MTITIVMEIDKTSNDRDVIFIAFIAVLDWRVKRGT
jgi:hypothetical protein